MNLPTQVAQALEFSGYGPAIPVDEKTIHVRLHRSKRDPMDFTLELTATGDVVDMVSPWAYQNPMRPDVKAVLTIVSKVFMEFGDYEFYGDVLEEDFQTTNFLVRSIFLWQDNPEAIPEERKYLILNEFLINREPVWHQLQTTAYGGTIYAEFYAHTTDLLQEFKEKGTLPSTVTIKDLDKLIAACTEG